MPTPPMPKPCPKPIVGIWDAVNSTRYSFNALEFDGRRKTRIAIGKSRQSDIQIGDEYVSMDHCEIEWKDGNFVLRDVGSTNGTKIDRRPVNEDVVLQPDMYIHIGGAVLVVVAKDEWPELRARTHSSFLRRSEKMYGSDRKAEKKIRKGRSTIRRAVQAKKASTADK